MTLPLHQPGSAPLTLINRIDMNPYYKPDSIDEETDNVVAGPVSSPTTVPNEKPRKSALAFDGQNKKSKPEHHGENEISSRDSNWCKLRLDDRELKVKFAPVGEHVSLTKLDGWFQIEPVSDTDKASKDFGVDLREHEYAVRLVPIGDNPEYEMVMARRVRPVVDLPNSGTIQVTYPFVDSNMIMNIPSLHEVRRSTSRRSNSSKRIPSKKQSRSEASELLPTKPDGDELKRAKQLQNESEMDQVPVKMIDEGITDFNKMLMTRQRKSRTLSKFSLVNCEKLYSSAMPNKFENSDVGNEKRKYLTTGLYPIDFSDSLAIVNNSIDSLEESRFIPKYDHIDKKCISLLCNTKHEDKMCFGDCGFTEPSKMECCHLNVTSVNVDVLHLFKEKSLFTNSININNIPRLFHRENNTLHAKQQSISFGLVKTARFCNENASLFENSSYNIEGKNEISLMKCNDVTEMCAGNTIQEKNNKNAVIIECAERENHERNQIIGINISKVALHDELTEKTTLSDSMKDLSFTWCMDFVTSDLWPPTLVWKFKQKVIYKQIMFARIIRILRNTNKKERNFKRKKIMTKFTSSFIFQEISLLFFFLLTQCMGIVTLKYFCYEMNKDNKILPVRKYYFYYISEVKNLCRFYNKSYPEINPVKFKKKIDVFNCNEKQDIVSNKEAAGDFIRPTCRVPGLKAPKNITKKLKDLNSLKVTTVPCGCLKRQQSKRVNRSANKSRSNSSILSNNSNCDERNILERKRSVGSDDSRSNRYCKPRIPSSKINRNVTRRNSNSAFKKKSKKGLDSKNNKKAKEKKKKGGLYKKGSKDAVKEKSDKTKKKKKGFCSGNSKESIQKEETRIVKKEIIQSCSKEEVRPERKQSRSSCCKKRSKKSASTDSIKKGKKRSKSSQEKKKKEPFCKLRNKESQDTDELRKTKKTFCRPRGKRSKDQICRETNIKSTGSKNSLSSKSSKSSCTSKCSKSSKTSISSNKSIKSNRSKKSLQTAPVESKKKEKKSKKKTKKESSVSSFCVSPTKPVHQKQAKLQTNRSIKLPKSLVQCPCSGHKSETKIRKRKSQSTFFSRFKAVLCSFSKKESSGKRASKSKDRVVCVKGKFRVRADYCTGKIDIDVDSKSKNKLMAVLDQFSDDTGEKGKKKRK